MDATANLTEQRSTTAEIAAIYDSSDEKELSLEQLERLAELAYTLAEHVHGLDEWLAHQGDLPAQWQRVA